MWASACRWGDKAGGKMFVNVVTWVQLINSGSRLWAPTLSEAFSCLICASSLSLCVSQYPSILPSSGATVTQQCYSWPAKPLKTEILKLRSLEKSSILVEENIPKTWLSPSNIFFLASRLDVAKDKCSNWQQRVWILKYLTWNEGYRVENKDNDYYFRCVKCIQSHKCLAILRWQTLLFYC